MRSGKPAASGASHGRTAVPDSDLDRLFAVLGPRLDEFRSLFEDMGGALAR